MRPTSRLTSLVWAASLSTVLAVGCTSTEEATYSLQIIGPPDAFVGATSAVLYLRDQEVARTSVNDKGAFTLEAGGLDPADSEQKAVFAVRGLDAQGGLVAYGESPLVEMRTAAQDLKIFVQKPGTVALSTDFPVKLRNQTVFTAKTQPTVSVVQELTAPVFAHGETVDKQFSRALYVYNPLSHAVEKVTDLARARSGAVGISRPLDGALFLFGGFLLPAAMTNPADSPGLKASPQLDLLVVGRENFKKFSLPEEPTTVTTNDPLTARAGAVTASLGGRHFMLGGIDDFAAPAQLPSVAVLEEVQRRVYEVRTHSPMLVARSGHTATADPTVGQDLPMGTVLVYGGAPVGGGTPVAEFLEKGGAFAPLNWTSNPPGAETNRRFHQAVVLPTKDAGAAQVLIIGGLDDAGNPRADAVKCVPSRRSCVTAVLVSAPVTPPPPPGTPPPEPKPFTLQTARANFVAFVMNNDLVITGGTGPGNVPVGTTEIYDARTLAFVKTVPSLARSHLTVTLLDNLSAILSGGQVGEEVATAIEIYQPLRAQ